MPIAGTPMREIKLPELNGGLNTLDPEYSIADNQSPDLLNVWYKNKTLSKRPGQALQRDFGATVYSISEPYNDTRVVHAGTKLFAWDGTELKDDVGEGVFVEFGSNLYHIDGAEVWRISPDLTVTAVTPYAPVVLINARPDLSESTDNESYNLLGSGFTVWYNGDGESTTYKLPQTSLDDTTIKVTIGGADKTEGEHFTVNRNNGTISLSDGTSPNGAPERGTNNVRITAYKTIDGNKQKIAGCTLAITYGGESGLEGGTRVFVSGNSDHPYHYWRSDIANHQGMAYFPDTSEEPLDANGQPVTAMAKIGSQLVFFKTESIFVIGYAFDGQDAYFPMRECPTPAGCDVPGSVQLIDNKLVFCNTRSGLHMLISTNVELENIVKPISANINKLLLAEPGLDKACSADFERYYWLCVNGRVYLWDYNTTAYHNYGDYDKAQKRLAWYVFDNIHATEFAGDTELYFARENTVSKLIQKKNDYGEAYRCYFKSKAFDIGSPHYLKVFTEIYPSFSPDGAVQTTITATSEKTDAGTSRTYDIRPFDWDEFAWSAFSWNVIKFAKTYMMRTRLKNVSHIQVKAESHNANRGLGLSGLRVKYTISKAVKTRR